MKKFKILPIVLLSFFLSLSYGADASNSVVLSKDNVIILNGEVNGETVGAVISAAKELDNALTGSVKGKLGLSKHKPLYLFLNTPGGSIQSGLEMVEALNGLGRPVNTITLFSASMGFQIAQNLGDRLILKNGVMMSHHASGEFTGQFGGVSGQVDSRYKLWLDRIREMDEQTVKRTNGKQTYESYIKAYDHEVWLTGTKSVQEGYADKIVTVKCDLTLSGATIHSISFMGSNISYDLDNCPLNTSPMNIRISPQDKKKILSPDEITEIKTHFLNQYERKHKQVVPMYW